MLKREIKKHLKKIVSDLIKDPVDIKVNVPEFLTQGDYTTNIALVLFGNKDFQNNHKNFNSPRQLAEYMKHQLENLNLKIFDHIKVEGPGFINFWVNKKILIDSMIQIVKLKERFGFSEEDARKKIMVEFTDPNPFKEFHIGHLYSNSVGESIARLLESQNAEVARVCYQGDVGLHVAKAIWGMREKFRIHSSEFKIEEMERLRLSEQAKFLGESYALGAKEFEKSEDVKAQIYTLNKIIYDKSDSEVNLLYEMGRRWSLDYFESLYTRLGTRFAYYFFESQAAAVGMALVSAHMGSVFQEDAGAVIFPGKKYGLHNRVFVNSHGLPTYEAKDLALAPLKYKAFPYDLSIIVTANEQNAYFDVILKALSFIDPDLAAKTHHIGHGTVMLPSGKMSSRTGDVISGEWLLDATKKKIHENYPEMTGETAEMVAISAIKYAFLRSGIGQDITFSFEESISLDGNSGPYLQYTAVRCKSIIRKGQDVSFNLQINPSYQIQNARFEQEELELLRFLLHYSEVVQDAAEKYSPNILCNYLFNLAQKFNLFYQKHSILGLDKNKEEQGVSLQQKKGVFLNDDFRSFRLALTSAAGQILQNGLSLLGIQVPEKM